MGKFFGDSDSISSIIHGFNSVFARLLSYIYFDEQRSNRLAGQKNKQDISFDSSWLVHTFDTELSVFAYNGKKECTLNERTYKTVNEIEQK